MEPSKKVLKILNKNFEGLYFSPEENVFYCQKMRKRGMGFGPIAWKEATGTYKSSRGKDEKSYYYRYAVLPLKPLPAKERKTVGIHPAKDDETANHIRISEKDWNRMKNTNDLVQFE